MIAGIPLLEAVATIIAYQEKHFDGSGMPHEGRRGEEIPLESRIIKLALDFESYLSSGFSGSDALDLVKTREGWYDPAIVKLLETIISNDVKNEARTVRIDELTSDMIVDEDIEDIVSGEIIIPRGHEVTQSMCMHLRNLAVIEKIKDRINIIVAGNTEQSAQQSR